MNSGTVLAWTVVSTPLPPYVMKGEKPGYVIELIRFFAEEMDQTIEVTLTPWARAQQRAMNEGNLLIAPLTRTPLREEYYDWLIPLHDYRIWLVAIDPDIDISSIDSIRQQLVCALRESPSSHALSQLAIDNVVLFNDDRKCMQLMVLGRIKVLLAHGKTQALWSYALEGHDPAELRFGHSMTGGTLYLASSKGMLTEDQKIRFRELFLTIKKNGFFDHLIEKYSVPPGSYYLKDQESGRPRLPL